MKLKSWVTEHAMTVQMDSTVPVGATLQSHRLRPRTTTACPKQMIRSGGQGENLPAISKLISDTHPNKAGFLALGLSLPPPLRFRGLSCLALSQTNTSQRLALASTCKKWCFYAARVRSA